MKFSLSTLISILLGAVIMFGVMTYLDDENVSESLKKQDSSEGSQNQWATPKVDENYSPATLSLDYVEKVLSNVSLQQRQAVLENAENFSRFLSQENANLSVLRAAKENKLEQDQNAHFLMQRSAENVLRQAYLNILIKNKLPEDFPTNQQVEEYYNNNKERFVIAERVHVWQIFLPLSSDADESLSQEKMQEAKNILQQIESKSIDFASAARQFSEHNGSRNNGGYMGLVNIQELLPEIREPILQLPEDKLSPPLRTDAGIHLVKRGPMIDPLPVELSEVESQIKQLLIRQASQQLQAAILQEAIKQYGENLEELPTEEWRNSLTESQSQ